MNHFIICKSTDPQWLAERRKRVTASGVSTWMGTQPKFYKDASRENMIAMKLQGAEKSFDDRANRRMTHGTEREANALRMAGEMFGFPTAPYQCLVGNERWPFLAATLDGLLFPWVGREPNYSLTSQVGHMAEIRSIIEFVGEPVMTEIKVTDSGHRYKDKDGPHAGRRAWSEYSPYYHMEQVQTGMHMTGFNHSLLTGLLGGDDLICWYHQRKEEWADVLDQVNSEAEAALGGLW